MYQVDSAIISVKYMTFNVYLSLEIEDFKNFLSLPGSKEIWIGTMD